METNAPNLNYRRTIWATVQHLNLEIPLRIFRISLLRLSLDPTLCPRRGPAEMPCESIEIVTKTSTKLMFKNFRDKRLAKTNATRSKFWSRKRWSPTVRCFRGNDFFRKIGPAPTTKLRETCVDRHKQQPTPTLPRCMLTGNTENRASNDQEYSKVFRSDFHSMLFLQNNQILKR